MSQWPVLNSDKCLGVHPPPYEPNPAVWMLCSSLVVVIPHGSGVAKYKSCNRVPHSEQMKSGAGQERVGHTHWAGCGDSYCSCTDSQTSKVRGEWFLNIIDNIRKLLPQLHNIINAAIKRKNKRSKKKEKKRVPEIITRLCHNRVAHGAKSTVLNELDHNIGHR